MKLKTDVRPVGVKLFFLPIKTRIPAKFGTGILTEVTCARVCLKVKDSLGREKEGWGETPLSVEWVWPGELSYREREDTLMEFCKTLADAWAVYDGGGHALEVGHGFIENILPELLEETNKKRGPKTEPMPWLAALVCCSAFDIALHDAYANLHGKYVYDIYNRELTGYDLSRYLTPADGAEVSFANKYPCDFLEIPGKVQLPAWHLVGGLDLLDPSELKGTEPDDGYPVLLADWIHQDGLKCLKVKLRGNDGPWDYDRVVRVGEIAEKYGVLWLTFDFNCTVTQPGYVIEILDRLIREHPRIYGMLLYVEQPFPYDLEKNRIDVHAISAKKPLFMDESAHDWKLVKLGRSLGWNGVALKTCKTQTGAILSLCWAKAHGMGLMVQDLANPMLAQIPHLSLASHAGTIMGVETNSMQFYPDASLPEAAVHAGMYKRRGGHVDLGSLKGSGFGYRLDEIDRILPPMAHSAGVT